MMRSRLILPALMRTAPASSRCLSVLPSKVSEPKEVDPIDKTANKVREHVEAAVESSRLSFGIPNKGPASADAPDPAVAQAMGLGLDWMTGMVDVVAGAARMEGGRVKRGVDEMAREGRHVIPTNAPPSPYRYKAPKVYREDGEDF